ncbi:Predicted membrane protein [Kingella potus]|uniref:Predicted membrane protein n=1 Tax=Kingella potus TaxID=265175 RepID=A0A377R367_9NEIS|nr:energy-coupling factor ABC transporter permease [Kingella potus]UOO99955.1 energy-coupling factor ABC transporter permease [Kingella potus]STR03227.1 Predicted membrane protein [Kingella potus]
MDFRTEWFAPALHTAACAVLLILLAACAKPALASLRARPQACGVLLCFFAAFWSLDAGADGGLTGGLRYHLLGVPLGCLMIGAPAVLWLAALFMPLHLLLSAGQGGLAVWPLDVLFAVLPAAAVAETLKYAVRRFLPPNLFLYIFINGFFAAALGMLAAGAAAVALLAHTETFAAADLWRRSFPVFFLLGWGEAFLTGLFAAVFVAFKPHLLASFDDAHYLRRRNSIWPSENQP